MGAPLAHAAATLLGLAWGWAWKTGLFVASRPFVERPLWFALVAGVAACLLSMRGLLRLLGGRAGQGTPRRLEWPVVGALCITVLAVVVPLWIDRRTLYVFGVSLSKFYPPAVLLLAVRLLMPGATRALLRRLGWDARRRRLVGLLSLSALLIPCTEVLASGVMLGDPSTDIHLPALGLTWLMLVALFALGVGLGNRLRLAALLCTASYVGFCLLSARKIQLLESPISVLDLASIPEVWTVYTQDLAARSSAALPLAALALVAVLWRLACAEAPALRGLASRLALVSVGLLTLGAVSSLSYFGTGRALLAKGGVVAHTWGRRGSTRANGLWLDAVLATEALARETPAGYDREAIEDVLARRGTPPPAPYLQGEPIDLVVYFIEAFWDPGVLGVAFTRDPLPNYHRMRDRFGTLRAVSPVFGGLSCNSELELLTGLSTHFLPRSGTPAYSRFIRRDVPSLPRELQRLGYSTRAVLVEGLWFQGRSEAFPHIGLHDTRTLNEVPGLPRDAAGRVVSDEALVDALIDASRGPGPRFLFAFANATHMPWDYAAYLDSDLDTTAVLPEPGHARFKTYINALHAADAAIGKLVAHFERSSRKTMVLILGDHLPLVLDQIELPAGLGHADEVDGLLRRYAVHGVLWSNFERPRQDLTISNNLLATHVLRQMGIAPSGYLGLIDGLRQRYPVIGRFLQTGNDTPRTPATATPAQRRMLEDYRLLQYDVLFGERHLGTLLATPADAVSAR